jgi:FMN-dependent oxidoreductase (nitrilotriacetate monooxygenase family)
MAKKFHLAWFGNSGPTNWSDPIGTLYDYRQPEIYQEVAKLCERAKFDMVIFADSLSVPKSHGGSRDWYVKRGIQIPQDPVPILAMMAAVTKHIGLAATLSTTFYPPYLLARLLGTMDHLTAGRVAWNVVTSASKDAARNFGYDELLDHDERYDRADEYMDLCRSLWDSWEPDAVVMDRENNIFADPSKVHSVDFKGKYYKSAGPLNITSSPQRYPVISVAGSSPRGTRFAAKHGDMAIGHKNSVADMKFYVDNLRQRAAEEGRDPASIKVFFSIKPVIGDSEAEAKERWAKNFEEADIEEGLAILSNYLGIDLSTFELDKPLPRDLKVNGIIGSMQRYLAMPAGSTLRDWAKEEAMHETFPICGTPEQCADMMEQAIIDTGCDGFHVRAGVSNYPYLLEFTTKLIPVLQRRGLTRTEYAGSTLKENLFAF